MNDVMLATVALVALLGGFGAWSLYLAFRHTGKKKPRPDRGQVWAALAAGLLTGAAVAVGVVLLQKWDTNSSADAVWRASVETAADIPGFSPGGHSLRGMDLSGKQLEDANLRRADLRGVELRDTNLTGAYLNGADFHGDIMYSANLDNTTLAHADFSNASVMGVQFVGADWKYIKSFVGAKADAFTCWPPGFLESPLAKGIIPKPHGNVPASVGREANSSGKCPPT